MTFGCCNGEVHVHCGLRCYQTGNGCPLCRAAFHPHIQAAFGHPAPDNEPMVQQLYQGMVNTISRQQIEINGLAEDIENFRDDIRARDRREAELRRNHEALLYFACQGISTLQTALAHSRKVIHALTLKPLPDKDFVAIHPPLEFWQAEPVRAAHQYARCLMPTEPRDAGATPLVSVTAAEQDSDLIASPCCCGDCAHREPL